jgi:diguanylate cyclase (GGDEF)-like protein/PAS domain S-box-containing protein
MKTEIQSRGPSQSQYSGVPATLGSGAAASMFMHALRLAVLLIGGVALVQSVGPASLQLDTATYAGLHTLAELFAVVVALLIFGVGWTNAGPLQTRLNVLLACAFLAVGLLDLLHLLSYAGMPNLVTPADPEKAIFFWLAARFVAALGLLLLVFFPYQGSASRRLRASALSASLILVALTAWIGLWHGDWIPRTFIADQGLTPLKIVAELSISGLFLVAAGALIVGRRPSTPFCADSLLTALIVLAFSGLCFTLYTQVSDGLNLLGHVYKILAYLFLYHALFHSAIAQPYQELLRARDLLAHEQAALQVSEARLREREERLSLVMEGSNDGFWDWNIATGSVFFSDRWATMLGYQPTELESSVESWKRLVHPDDQARVVEALDAHFAGRSERYEIEHRLRSKTGEWRWILDRGRVTAWDADGRPLRMAGTHSDVSERHAIEGYLREREELLGTLIATMHDGCLLYDGEGQVTLWNQRAEQILGLNAAQLRCQEPAPPGWRVLDEEGQDFPPAQHPALRAIASGQRYADIVVAIRQPSGNLTWIIASAAPLYNERADSRGAFLTFTDISALKAAEIALRQQQLDLRMANAQLQALATTDGLTGLANHRALQQAIAASTRLAEHTRQPLALIMLDIDHFKRFNDTFGHPSGDHVLRVVAGVLRATVRASDTVARYGGEEFAILLTDSDIDGAAETAERCRCAINDLIWEYWPITASFGVATWHPTEGQPQTLIDDADAALYQAKRDGRNQVALACCAQAQSNAA